MVIGNIYDLTVPDPRESARIAQRYGIPVEWAELVEQAAASVGGYGSDLAAVIWHESRFNPRAQFGYIKGPPHGRFIPGRAVGLIQFKESAARSLGSNGRAIFAMPFDQQMGLVAKYLQRVAAGKWAGGDPGPLDNIYRMALSVFYPARRNEPPDAELSAAAQEANPGVVTIGDYVERVLHDSEASAPGSDEDEVDEGDEYVADDDGTPTIGGAFVDNTYDLRHPPRWLVLRSGW